MLHPLLLQGPARTLAPALVRETASDGLGWADLMSPLIHPQQLGAALDIEDICPQNSCLFYTRPAGTSASVSEPSEATYPLRGRVLSRRAGLVTVRAGSPAPARGLRKSSPDTGQGLTEDAQQGEWVRRPLRLRITRSFCLQLHNSPGQSGEAQGSHGTAAVLAPTAPS